VTHELREAIDAIDGADRTTVDETQVRQLRQLISALRRDAQKVLGELAELPLETPRN
jgi:hypothetical protein